MGNRIITNEELNKWLQGIIDSGVETFAVQEKQGGKFHYAPLKNAQDMRPDYDVTLTPPKKFFLPERETLFNFKMAPEVKTSATFDTNKRILLGVHPYDMIAINQMDEIFRNANEDAHYFKRRNNTVIVGLDPQNISAWGFWCAMGTGTTDKGYDLWLTKLDDNRYFLEVATDAGGELVKNCNLTDAQEADVNKRTQIRADFHKMCNEDRKLSVSAGEIPSLVKENWDNKTWEERSKKCYSCGSCNLVCPTCYCFDVKDEFELNLEDGKRVRNWDGCQLETFAAVGHGENFREKRVDRFRHRFYRKTVYQYERYNQLACVGCGRCSSVCLPNIADPVDILNTIKEGK